MSGIYHRGTDGRLVRSDSLRRQPGELRSIDGNRPRRRLSKPSRMILDPSSGKPRPRVRMRLVKGQTA